MLFVTALAAAKHWHNCKQVAYVAALPQRTKAHFGRVNPAAEDLWGMRGASLEEVRQRIDPRGAARGYQGWSTQVDEASVQYVSFRDPDSVTSVNMRLTAGHLREAWVRYRPYMDEPLPFWVAGEWIRKAVGTAAGLLWLLAVVGAYAEPLLRGRMAWVALACAALALAAWSVEPPASIRDPGPRVPHGPWVGGALVLLTLPALVMSRRNARRTGVCRHCGYDLTGNVSGICPECGHATPAELLRRRQERSAPFAIAFEEEPQDVTPPAEDDTLVPIS